MPVSKLTLGGKMAIKFVLKEANTDLLTSFKKTKTCISLAAGEWGSRSEGETYVSTREPNHGALISSSVTLSSEEAAEVPLSHRTSFCLEAHTSNPTEPRANAANWAHKYQLNPQPPNSYSTIPSSSSH
jgi:hypothetical protein